MKTNLNVFNPDERLSWKSPDDIVLIPKDLRVDVFNDSYAGCPVSGTISPAVKKNNSCTVRVRIDL